MIEEDIRNTIYERHKSFLNYKSRKNLSDDICYEKWMGKEIDKEDVETEDEDNITKPKQDVNALCKLCKKSVRRSNLSYHMNSCLGLQYFNYMRGIEPEGRAKCQDCGKIYLRKNEKQHECDKSKKNKYIKCEFCGFNFENHKNCAVKMIVDLAKHNADMEISELVSKRNEMCSGSEGRVEKENVHFVLMTTIELKELAQLEKKTIAQLKVQFERRRARAEPRQRAKAHRKQIDWMASIIASLPEEYRKDELDEDNTPSLTFRNLISYAKAAEREPKSRKYDYKRESKRVEKIAKVNEARDREYQRIFQQDLDEYINSMDEDARVMWFKNQEELKEKLEQEKFDYELKIAEYRLEQEIKFAEKMDEWRIQKEKMSKEVKPVEEVADARAKLIEGLFEKINSKKKSKVPRPFIDPSLKTLPQVEPYHPKVRFPFIPYEKLVPVKITENEKFMPEKNDFLARKRQKEPATKSSKKQERREDYWRKREELEIQHPKEALRRQLGIYDEEFEKKLAALGYSSDEEMVKADRKPNMRFSFPKPKQPKQVLSVDENTIIKDDSLLSGTDDWKMIIKSNRTQISLDALNKSKFK
jgi:hypothetical protein